MADTLTTDDLEILRARFAFADHEFLRGLVYITEEPIMTRIEAVDPAYRFEILSIFNSGDQVVVTARMTLKGVSRDGVGMQKVLPNSGEAEKAAATDAMKRCARLFGIGRYLLGAPSGEDAFKKWLGGAQPQQSPTVIAVVSQESLNHLSKLAKDDLRNRDAAMAFMVSWRSKSLTDGDVLAALGVGKLSEWEHGRVAADDAVNAYVAAKPKSKAG